ncbi:phosphotransferase enzyme family protein [Histoplasma capsulatum G186AR]|uniref:Phosphotransferase enzyme family protein n=2 Tax=Ajellomyces capsulatus TaxID=5037 RepID=C0NEN9_AJECG|nr:phosphotransferase enzyme family protein [Histoplasma capsulatum G186AR]EEH09710.1 phosphotransferase enzyme family protein [Histoplasma capsulatum G186AR]
MDTNALIDLVHEMQGQLWVDQVNETLRTGLLCEWVSTFHPNKLPCQLDGPFHHGAFNAGMKMVFSDSTTWMVRFPRVGMVCDNYADEKVAMEVTALSLIHDRTTIPVPRIQAWGNAASNPLDLGPFIIMDFIDGVSLSDILNDTDAERPTRLMREDINDSDIEIIYRQLANYLLQLFKLDFDQIGSLPWPGVKTQSATPARPLTFKAHSILQNGGVNTFGDRRQGFTTTAEYFQYVVEQDWEQLVQQPNSTVGLYDAKNKYVAFKVLKALISDLVNTKYDRCKFKLICDDLGLANLIVQSREDLTVVGVVDLEWSYIGPAQLFGSAPWWLLQDRPVNSAWDCKDDKPPKIAGRYFKCLEIFTRILEEEESKMPGHEEKELSSLVRWSQSSGAMWLHMLLSSGFNDHRSFPFTQLRQYFGTEWAKRENEFNNEEELEAFAARKMSELEQYDEVLEKREDNKALVDSGKMTKEEFIATALSKTDTSSCSPLFIANNESRDDKGFFHKAAAWLGA